jgi:uncharacterized iron-regulated membrane protein
MPISFGWANALVYRVVGEAPPPRAANARANGNAPRANGSASRSSGQAARTNGNAPRAARVHTDGLDALWARAEAQVPGWRSITLRLPASPDAPAVFAIDAGNGGQPQLRSTLTLERSTGRVVSWEPFDGQTPGRRLRSWTRFTHTGEYYGLIGQTVAGLVSLGAVILVYTGLALAFRRFFGKTSTSGGRAAERGEAAEIRVA